MKLKSDFIVHRTEKEAVLAPVGGSSFSGIMKGNNTLGEILDLLKEETSKAALIQAMLARYDAPEEVIARDVEKALKELRSIGALAE